MPRHRSRPAVEGQAVDSVNYWPPATPEGIVSALKRWSEAPDIDSQPERIDGVPALRTRLLVDASCS